MQPYRAAVIGAGRIGSTYDGPGDALSLTHCHAFSNHPRVALAAVIDSDPARAAEAAERWGTVAYSDVEHALAEAPADVVSVCTPTATHLEVVRTVARFAPSFVFLEKPIGASAGEVAEIVRILDAARVPCMVNYPRSFDPAVQATARAVRAGEYGDFITGAAYYAKGIRNNGSHMVDLLHTILEPVASVEVVDARQDHPGDDLSADVFIRLESGGTFHLIPVDERAYSITDVTFFFRSKRVHFRNFGLEMCLSSRREDPVFPGYWDLTDQKDYVQTGLSHAMDRAVEQIVRFLDDGTPYDSDLESAMRTERVVDEIATLARAKHRTIGSPPAAGPATV